MGFRSLFKELKNEAKKVIEETSSSSSSSAPPPSSNPTRWEKAVISLNSIVQQVSQIDPDGVDVYCVPGGEGTGFDVYRNLKDTDGLEAMVTARKPSGACRMSNAMEAVFNEAFARGFERPCSILVLTAGRPDDHENLSECIKNAALQVENDSDMTVTFVHIGDDAWAETYLKHLDDDLTCTSKNGDIIDIVDTVKDEDIKNAMGEFKDSGGKGGAGALFGAFAGAALGVGGMYMYNQVNKEKRTEGWNGKWKLMQGDDEIAVLDVTDDKEGNLSIGGWPEIEGAARVFTSTGSYEDNEFGYNIMHNAPGDDEPAVATSFDEHTISWSNGTRWEEVPPEGQNWGMYAGAAAGGAAAAGGVGYLMGKKFFSNADKKIPSDYVIVMDRSQMMAIPDTGK